MLLVRLEIIVCILIYVSMYLYSYLSTHGKSGLPAHSDWEQFEVRLKMAIEWTQRYARRPCSSDFGDGLGGRDRANLEMHLEAEIEWTQRCTGRPWSTWSSEFEDELWGCDRASLEIQLETKIEWTQRCTARLWLSEFGDALGGRGRVNWEKHLDALIERVWRCTWWPRSSELRDALWGCDRASFEMQLETVFEWTQRFMQRPWSSEFGDALVACYDRARLEEYLELGDRKAVDRRRARCWDSIHRLVNLKPWECDEVTLPLKLLWRTGWWQWIVRAVCQTFSGHLEIVRMKGRQTILGVCCTRFMLHSVLTHDDGMER